VFTLSFDAAFPAIGQAPRQYLISVLKLLTIKIKTKCAIRNTYIKRGRGIKLGEGKSEHLRRRKSPDSGGGPCCFD
jgi:hypothetical protein